jgi:hypothetical protein
LITVGLVILGVIFWILGALGRAVGGVATTTDTRRSLRTYVHLMDEGVGDAAFMDDVLAEVPADTPP